jgi:apolipoprotein D and lipocalin family protein
MKLRILLPGLFLVSLQVSLSCAPSLAVDTLPTVSKVDLNRYAGRWHEIARLPMFFQRNCTGEVTAQYSLKPNGKVEVVNQCRQKDGSLSTARGTARVVDPATNAKLKVSFFWPFSGDYWILALGSNYEYALVGEPGRKYLWILARQPEMEESLYQKLVLQAKSLGFDTSRLIRSSAKK